MKKLLLLLFLSNIIDAQQATEIDSKSLRTPRYANLAAINSAIPSPLSSGSKCYFKKAN